MCIQQRVEALIPVFEAFDTSKNSQACLSTQEDTGISKDSYLQISAICRSAS